MKKNYLILFITLFMSSLFLHAQDDTSMITITFPTNVDYGTVTVDKDVASDDNNNAKWVSISSGDQVQIYTPIRITLTPDEGCELETFTVNGEHHSDFTEIKGSQKRFMFFLNDIHKAGVTVEASFRNPNPENGSAVLTYTQAAGGTLSVDLQGQVGPNGPEYIPLESGSEISADQILRFTLKPNEQFEVESLKVNDTYYAAADFPVDLQGVKILSYGVTAKDVKKGGLKLVPSFRSAKPLPIPVRFEGSADFSIFVYKQVSASEFEEIQSEDLVDKGTVLKASITANPGKEIVKVKVDKGEYVQDLTANPNGDYLYQIAQDDMFVIYKVTLKDKAAGDYVTVSYPASVLGGLFQVKVKDGEALAPQSEVAKGSVLVASYEAKVAGYELASFTVNGSDQYFEDMKANKSVEIVADKDIVIEGSFAEGQTGIAQEAVAGVYYDAATEVLNVPADATVALYDLIGRRVAEVKGNLSLSTLPEGLYLAKVEVEGATVVVKVVK